MRRGHGRALIHDLVDSRSAQAVGGPLVAKCRLVWFANANRKLNAAPRFPRGRNDPDIAGQLADDLFQQQDTRHIHLFIADDEDAGF